MGKQSELKYQRLLQKAEELFIKRGYKNVSIDEIAAYAGISKVTIYKHFDSKEALFIHIVTDITDKHYNLLESNLNSIPSAVDKLHYLFSFSIESHRKYSQAFYQDMMEIPFIWEQIYAYRKNRAIAICEQILEAGILTKELRSLNVKYTISLLLQLGEALPKMYPFDNQAEAELFLESYYDFIKHALMKH
ncbi:TetR/AcrR family transcriptional regulator [Desulfuribacillus alkaliarsenatis]|uniref:HTH tetR-type domain-containing protein n=1 Tax=Desulfuribacillus alkaliarsenatis TaxID=766136 RepID=A0A1E5G2F7_9FIRM|nr:TetR/AcrR family transcriptional regulator [Desulfuribacillus alkaliarsenatis]OEF97161.1 hypothetical protein BHF68_06075 [Desulfuribacillus alkaliarsenatis]